MKKNVFNKINYFRRWEKWRMKNSYTGVKKLYRVLLVILMVFSLNSLNYAAQLPKVHTNPQSSSVQPFRPNQKGIIQVQNKKFKVAQNHILVKLGKGTDKTKFQIQANNMGLMKIGQIYKSDWYIMSIPTSQKPVDAITAAKGIPGVLNATPDPLIMIQQNPPRDPIYKMDDDGDPSTKPCDPIEEICTDPYVFVDQWGLFQVGAESAWSIQTGISEKTIAIIDSGIDVDHDDLFGNIWVNPGEIANNNIDDDGNGIVDDINGADFVGMGVGASNDPVPPNSLAIDGNPDIPSGGNWVEDSSAACGYPYSYGLRYADSDPAVGDACDNNFDYVADAGVFHGTMVAGVAAAMTDNINSDTGLYEGMAGACWNCKLMGVRMINAEGWGLGSAAASAIIYAAEMGADIINLSWGFDTSGPDPDGEVAAIVDAVNYAANRGAIIVAAAGNGSGPPVLFPASLPNTIAVGSTNWLDQVSDFSSTMTMTQVSSQVLDVVAPGELIWSTCVFSAMDELVYNLFLGDPSVTAGLDTYCGANGTSFSAPLVSGYIGLLLSQDPSLIFSDIRAILHDNAVDIEDSGYDALSGHGRFQMVIPDISSPPQNIKPEASFDFVTNGLSVDFTNTSTDNDGTINETEWSFGDGTLPSITSNPSHDFDVPGTYSIKLTVTDNAGDSASVIQDVEVSEYTLPTVSFSYTCNGLECTFESTSSVITGSYSYAWDFGDGNTSTGQTIVHSYSRRGNYTVVHRLTDNVSEGSGIVTTGVNVKKRGISEGSTGGSEPPSPETGDTNSMYLWDITMAKKGKSMNVSVYVRRDSDGDGVSEDTDAPVDSAYIEGWLCPASGGTCSFVGNKSFTDGNGKANWKLLGATASGYSFEVKSIDRPPYTWNTILDDPDNPSFYQ